MGGHFFCPITLDSFYTHAWNLFGSPRGWKAAREKRPVAENSLALQKSQEEELAGHRGRGACVVPLVARWCGGEAVSRLDGGWIPASGAGGGGGRSILQCWHSHWDSGQPWNKSCEEAERKKKTAPVVYFVETKRESHLWMNVIELRFVCGWMAVSKYGWKWLLVLPILTVNRKKELSSRQRGHWDNFPTINIYSLTHLEDRLAL